MKYVDLHTHQVLARDDESLGISNICYHELSDHLPDGMAFSLGHHPWYLSAANLDPEKFYYAATHPNILAVGEIGLDKFKGPELGIQTAAFTTQLEIAEQLRKPVIIHCVKRFNEVLHIRKQMKPKVAWIFHGFQGKPELARQLLLAGCYLSIGEALFNSAQTIRESLLSVPLDRLFFETDTTSFTIQAIYKQAARLMGCALEDLVKQLYQNYNSIFD